SLTISSKLGYTTTATTGSTAAATSLGQGVKKGDTAGIGFWKNRNGQALLTSFNGGATASWQRRQGGSSGSPGAPVGGCTLRSTARKAAWRSASLGTRSVRSAATTSAGSFISRHSCSTNRSASGRKAAASRLAW